MPYYYDAAEDYYDAAEAPGSPADSSGPGRVNSAQLMIETLEESLSQLSGNPVRIRSFDARALGKSTSFPIHRVDVQLQSGEVLPVIFKDLNPLRQLQNAKGIRQLELGRSRREIWMYRRVLPGLGLGTPRRYGHRWEPRRGNLWLFLEDAGAYRLDGQHITGSGALGAASGLRTRLALFEEAAAWADRFHTATTGAPGGEPLLRYDRDHYERQGRHLEACLDRIAEPDRPLVERALARHGELVQVVDGLPHGIIHGEFFGKDILVRRDQATDVLAVIDWETAAMRPQYVDLVSVSAGRWMGSQRMAMRRAYFDTRHAPAGTGADWRRFNEEADVAAILQAVSWLGFWVGSDTSDTRYARHVSRWMRELRITMGEDLPV
jgi:Phosphotransferase enzyme family